MLQAIKGSRETILIVEDNLEVQRIIKLHLDALDYRVIEADSAAGALEVLNKGDKIDFLFSDIVMSEKLNGLDLANLAAERWPSLKVVLTSGFPENKVNSKGDQTARIKLLTTSYRKTELTRIFREVLELSGE